MFQAVALRSLSVLKLCVLHAARHSDCFAFACAGLPSRKHPVLLTSPDALCAPMTSSPPPAYMPLFTPIKCLGLDCLGGDGAGTPVFKCHTIRLMTRVSREPAHMRLRGLTSRLLGHGAAVVPAEGTCFIFPSV